MDRNSIVGLFLIGIILVVFNMFFLPEPPVKEIAPASIQTEISVDSTTNLTEELPEEDSLVQAAAAANYGVFAPFATGKESQLTLENNLIAIRLNTKGGAIEEVELKEFKNYSKTPLILFEKGQSRYSYSYSAGGRTIETADLFFSVVSKTDTSLSFRLALDDNRYIQHSYYVRTNSYLVGHEVNLVGMEQILASNISYTTLHWSMNTPSQEKDIEDQRKVLDIYYKYVNDSPDYLTITKDDSEDLKNLVKWVSFKQKFFVTSLIARESFEEGKIGGGPLLSDTHVAKYNADLVLPIKHKATETYGMDFYFGPNHFQTLKTFDLGLEKQVPLGWGIFGWVNRLFVITTFNWLDSFGLNYGLIIFILTLIFKVLLFPLTYKSYLSAAKMKVLKPEIDELKAKYEKEPQKVQSEQMKLFQKAGVNPLGGCFPLLLQFPILIALFNFFPASIELRQQPFLWADDLSSYDSILDLPFHIPFYGAHVSLFTLLMTVSTIIYTRMNNQITGATGQMKYIGYIMPLVFLPVLNSYSSALSYYYFLANMITFTQQWVVRRFVIDEDAIHRKIQENKKKPVKRSKFQEKLESISKAAQQQQQAKAAGKKK
ncbi:MAG: membrane protein insertase YidC [Sphingobacteriaceae bacterium]|nr:membrane protein insertase YidC [Sphingobacteriaceae bacterium]